MITKEMLERLLQEGKTQVSIAKEFNVWPSKISTLIKKYGLESLRPIKRREYKSSPLCKECGETNVDFFFSTNFSMCKKCLPKQALQSRHKAKKQIIDYKGSKCQVCGYNKSIFALDLHHINPQEKDVDMFKFLRRTKCFNLERIKEELDKCILLCANCHREIHAGDLVLNLTKTIQ